MSSLAIRHSLGRKCSIFAACFALFFLSSLLGLFATLGIGTDHALAEPGDNPGASQTKAVQTAFVSPAEMNMGALLLGSKKPGKYIEAPRLATDVKITVTGIIARAVVTQRFKNPSDGWVEGIYVFPLPETAAVDTLKMRIGDRLIEGKIKRREEARKIYEAAKKAGKKASLVEQQRPNMFTNEVANIGPNETITVQIEYQERVAQDDGEYRLRFPLVVAPRYKPGSHKPVLQTVKFNKSPKIRSFDFAAAEAEEAEEEKEKSKAKTAEAPPPSAPVLHPSEGKINPVTLELKLNAGFALDDIESHHHKVQVKRPDADTAILGFSDKSVPADKDFELTWTPKEVEKPTASLFRERVNGEDYLVAMITPPSFESSEPAPVREVIFVIDNSGSMAGTSIRQAKASLIDALERLNPEDTFNVIRFDHTFDKAFDAALPASSENVKKARDFVSRLQPDGGTEMMPALLEALKDDKADDKTRLRQIVFLTDGAIGNERQLFGEIATKRGRSRIFMVGIGSSPNSYFMRRAAGLGRGTFTHIGSVKQVKERMDALLTQLESPQVTDLHAKWTAGQKVEVWPDPLPDLYAGEPIVIAAKSENLKGDLVIEGSFEGRSWKDKLSLSDAESGPGVSKLWAREKVAQLESMRHAGQNWKSIDAKIETIALDHHIVSRLTSLVAVDVTPSRPGDDKLVSKKVPLNLPAGWDFDKVFGGPVQQPSEPPMQDVNYRGMLNMAQKAPAQRGVELALVKTRVRGRSLPGTATHADRHIVIGILALILASICIIGFIAWHRVRPNRT